MSYNKKPFYGKLKLIFLKQKQTNKQTKNRKLRERYNFHLFKLSRQWLFRFFFYLFYQFVFTKRFYVKSCNWYYQKLEIGKVLKNLNHKSFRYIGPLFLWLLLIFQQTFDCSSNLCQIEGNIFPYIFDLLLQFSHFQTAC